MRHKGYLALLGLPLGLSSMLLSGGSAQAAETSVAAAPSASCSTIAFAPPNPFGNVVGEGFNAGESVRVSAGGQVIGTAPANAATIATLSSVNLSAQSYSLQGLTSGKTASCAGMAATGTTPTPTGTEQNPTGTTGTAAAVRAAGYSDGKSDALNTCQSGRAVTTALELQQGPKTEEYFAGYRAGQLDAQSLSACVNKPATPPNQPNQANQPNQPNQPNVQNPNQRRGQGERRGGNR
ncbi:hypothetical protein [Streptomyces sp. NPDC005181]|uniref:hypothetical protein n=1 Tax=Streptomyces sp. NPDC005181 TaxID=3156869 RepID=UPI0033B43E14